MNHGDQRNIMKQPSSEKDGKMKFNIHEFSRSKATTRILDLSISLSAFQRVFDRCDLQILRFLQNFRISEELTIVRIFPEF